MSSHAKNADGRTESAEIMDDPSAIWVPHSALSILRSVFCVLRSASRRLLGHGVDSKKPDDAMVYGLRHMLAESLVAQPQLVVGVRDEGGFHQHRWNVVIAKHDEVRSLDTPAGDPQHHAEFILDHLGQHKALRGEKERLRAVDGRTRRGVGVNAHVDRGAAL